MRQTSFITEGMRELLIPQVPLKEFTLEECRIPDIKDIDFFTLNTFPHIGDLVMIKGIDGKTLIKVRSIEWRPNNDIRVSGNVFEPENVKINLVAPIAITENVLEKLGFKYDSKWYDGKWGKFRLRLKSYPDIVLFKDSYGAEENLWYVKDMLPIRWIHELQAIFRVHHIDQAISNGLLFQLNEEAGKPSFLE